MAYDGNKKFLIGFRHGLSQIGDRGPILNASRVDGLRLRPTPPEKEFRLCGQIYRVGLWVARPSMQVRTNQDLLLLNHTCVISTAFHAATPISDST